jgi:hypothetical protein
MRPTIYLDDKPSLPAIWRTIRQTRLDRAPDQTPRVCYEGITDKVRLNTQGDTTCGNK